MQWYTTKRAYSGGKEIPIGTQGEGDVPANLVGKVAILVVATPQAEAEGSAGEESPAAEAEGSARRGRSRT
ncbi:hypothetical protein [Flavobacterium sp.]|jgi:hypothetical protein|uniref:hypothetical protein n=1 Tax=Flavobacterium sp. TaxID=239 RepID=UPI0037C099D9